tara:strand:- start:131 stop:775 length:645 start_codon:yes stop_codon:yes gene_type:complete
VSKEFKGVWIPKEIYQDKELNPTEKLILSDIATLGEYFKSNETIGKEVGISQCTVSRSITQLCDKGYIQTQYDGRTRLIKLQRTLIKMIKQPYQIDKADISNCEDSIQSSIQSSIHISKEVIFPFQNKEFIEAWKVWVLERKEKRLKSYTQRGEQSALHNLQKISGDNYKTAIQIINNSITHGWQGLFALKEQKTKRPKLDYEAARAWARGENG